MSPAPAIYRFEGFVLDPAMRLLSSADGREVPLTAKAYDTLLYLIEHRERVVDKDELLASVWRGRVVEENNLTQAISAIRRAFGTGAGDHRYVVTLPGHGYRFAAAVDLAPVEAAGPAGTPRQSGTHRAWWLAALLLALLALLATLASRKPEPEALDRRLAADATLAVLPFRPLSPTASDDLIGLGIADTLIARIGSSTTLRVRATASSQRFLGRPLDARQTARELGADYVLEGSTQRSGDMLRVGARLVSVSDGEVLWTGSFDEPATRVFALQDRLAGALTSVLRLRLTTPRAPTPCDGADPAAYREYVSGLYQINRPSRDRLQKAVGNFSRAIDLDPSCARAYAGLAFAYRTSVMTDDADPRRQFPLAKAAVEKAIALDPDLAEAHASRGFIQFWYDWDWSGSEASFRRAIALNPSLAEAHNGYAHLLYNLRRNQEAADQARQAVALDPLSPLIGVLGATFIAASGDREEAGRIQAAVAARDPDFWILHLIQGGMALAQQDDLPRAFDQLRKASQGCGGCSQAQSALGMAYARSGDRAGAERVLADMQARAATGYFPASSMAAVRNALGETEAALDLLERAYDQRDVRMPFLATDTRWNNVRGEPRFKALLQKMRLPEAASPQ